MRALAISTFAALVPISLVTLHMIAFGTIWRKRPVDKVICQCSCWDTIFKGEYEDGNIVRYKHVYFNSNSTTFKMWVSTVLFIIFMYESFKNFFNLLALKQIRWTMAVLVLGSLHSQYYSWWSFWNFWNDDFYSMWNHQLFFTLTEGISFILVLLSIDRSAEIKPWIMLVVCCIAIFHLLAGGANQFVANVIFGNGDVTRVLRDILFITSDLLFVAMSVYELWQHAATKEGVALYQFLLRRPNFILIGTLFKLMLCFVVIFPS